MKKTLLVTIDYPPRLGGIARYWQLVSELLPQNRLCVLADPEGDRLLFRRFWPRWLKGLPLMYKTYKQEACEQILAAQLLPVGTMAYMLHVVFRIPYVVQLYGMDLAMAQTSARKRWLAKRILMAADHCLVNSQATGRRLQVFGVHDYTVVYPIPRVDADAKPQPTDEKIILSVGRLVERKGHDLVIKALPEVLKHHPDAKYVIVGDGPHRGALVHLVGELGIDANVVFAGALNDDERNQWLAKCSMLVMPAREMKQDVEGFGMVFLEAYAFLKPVIGGRSGGVSEAVRDGETGLLVDPASVEEMAQAIKRLLEDDNLARQLGSNGFALLHSDFSIERMQRTLMAVL